MDVIDIEKETSRTYIFGDNNTRLTYENVSRVGISDTGGHYLNWTDAKNTPHKSYVQPGWLAIDMEEWTYPEEMNE